MKAFGLVILLFSLIPVVTANETPIAWTGLYLVDGGDSDFISSIHLNITQQSSHSRLGISPVLLASGKIYNEVTGAEVLFKESVVITEKAYAYFFIGAFKVKLGTTAQGQRLLALGDFTYYKQGDNNNLK